jgi:threonine synthase
VLYRSTRGGGEPQGFADVLLAGLAADGGLYVPVEWPQMPPDSIAAMAGHPYHEAAFEIVRPFIGGDIADDVLSAMIREAYVRFDHPAIAPLVQIAPNGWLLELFHGPTLAFKDIAMQLLARLMAHVLGERGSTACVIGATSGDTGSAAIEAFRGLDNIDLFILHPLGRVSDVQRRQMTCVADQNIHNIAIEGTFDDAQAIVKTLFGDEALREQVSLAGVNSINWARVMAQIVYYFTAAAALGAPHRAVDFCVPTGNFGDIYAGYAARAMGLAIDRLVIATNVNDILVRTLDTGTYRTGTVHATMSPSMDIQVSSNFERLLFDANDASAAAVRAAMGSLKQSGGFELSGRAHAMIKASFEAGAADEAQTAAAMKTAHEATGMLVDPHTAVGLHVAQAISPGASETPMISLATAHPAKFPDAVESATGIHPALPAALSDLLERPERYDTLANDASLVAGYIRDKASS